LYEDVKKMPQRRNQELPDQGSSLDFYKEARAFNAAADSSRPCGSTTIYLEACRDSKITSTPFLEKALHKNKLVLRNQHFNASQAQAVRLVLQDSM